MLLEAVLRHVTAEHGQAVGIVGEAGLGKSRLLEEFRQHLGAYQVTYAAGQCLAYGSASPYRLVAELLRECCGIAEGDSLETITTKARAGLQAAGLDPDLETPYLLHLLGMPVASDQFAGLSAEALKVRTFEMLQQMLVNYSRRRPLVLAVENLHWIDPTSEAFLTSLVERLAGVPMLLLTTYRPGYRPPWLEKSYAMQIALTPLGPDDSRQVMRSVLRQTSLEPVLEQQLLAKAQGNPLFLEELAHTMAEQESASPGLRVPDTIHAVLAARMDRLPAIREAPPAGSGCDWRRRPPRPACRRWWIGLRTRCYRVSGGCKRGSFSMRPVWCRRGSTPLSMCSRKKWPIRRCYRVFGNRCTSASRRCWWSSFPRSLTRSPSSWPSTIRRPA